MRATSYRSTEGYIRRAKRRQAWLGVGTTALAAAQSTRAAGSGRSVVLVSHVPALR
jgi:hypothetical protein